MKQEQETARLDQPIGAEAIERSDERLAALREKLTGGTKMKPSPWAVPLTDERRAKIGRSATYGLNLSEAQAGAEIPRRRTIPRLQGTGRAYRVQRYFSGITIYGLADSARDEIYFTDLTTRELALLVHNLINGYEAR